MDPSLQILGSQPPDPWIPEKGSGSWDGRIRRLGSKEPEAWIHGSGGRDPWIWRRGSMDPEAGIHGSGGWDPWIRRPGSMGLAMAMAMAGRPAGRPASACSGRPAGGTGPQRAQSAKKSEKPGILVQFCDHPRKRYACKLFPGHFSLIYDPNAHFRSFPTFEHFWSI